jgi:hypothetical protein
LKNIYKKHLALLLSAILLNLFACKTKEVTPSVSFLPSGFSGTYSIYDTITTLTKPVGIPVDNSPFINTTRQSNYATSRDGSTGFVKLTTLIGSTFDNVPIGIIQTLTQGNKKFKDLTISDSLRGWQIYSLGNLNQSNANVLDQTNRLSLNVSIALSGIFTYYPDGYYTYHTLRDSTQNDLGWYQIVMEGAYPTAIVYQSMRKGANFEISSDLSSPVLSYGIWGLDNKNLFLNVRLGTRSESFSSLGETVDVILKAKPIQY